MARTRKGHAEPDSAEFYKIPMTTGEAMATLAVLTAVRNALALDTKNADETQKQTFTEFDYRILDSAASRILEEMPEFALSKSDALIRELTDWLSSRPEPEPAPFTEHDDETPPFSTFKTQKLLERALRRGVPAEIEYYVRSREEWTVRRVDVEDVYEGDDTWYLEGYCRLRREHRLFRLDQIRAVRVSGEASEDEE